MMRFPQLPSFTFFAEIKFSVGTDSYLEKCHEFRVQTFKSDNAVE